MTKAELKDKLRAGYFMNDVFDFSVGQDCLMFKSDSFAAGDEIIYIPDVLLNDIPTCSPIVDAEVIDDVISICYTGDDFVSICSGDIEKAKRLFSYCDWQHPSSAVDEIDD